MGKSLQRCYLPSGGQTMDWLPLNQVSLTSNQLQQGAWSNPRVVSKLQMKWECSRKGTTCVYQNLLGNGTANKSWKGEKRPLKGTKKDKNVQDGGGEDERNQDWEAYSIALSWLATLGSGAQFSSFQLLSCAWLCNLVDCSTPAFRVRHQLLELAQTHVHQVSDAIQPSVIPFSSHLQSFAESGSFLMSWLFASSGQSTGASASVSVLPMNIQSWFPLGLTGLIFLPSKGLLRVFSSTTVRKYQFFDTQPSLWFNCHIHTWLVEKA